MLELVVAHLRLGEDIGSGGKVNRLMVVGFLGERLPAI